MTADQTDPSSSSSSIAAQLAGVTDQQLKELRHAKRVAIVVGLVVPFILIVAACIVLVVWMPSLPDPIANHWSASGKPDGFTSPAGHIMFTGAMSFGLALLMTLIGVLGSGKGSIAVWSGVNRSMVALGLGTSASITLLGVLLGYIQVGVLDARDAISVGWPVAMSFGVGILLGIAGYLVQPTLRIEFPHKQRTGALAMKPTERAVWVGAVRPSKGFILVMVATILFLVASTVIAIVTQLNAAAADASGDSPQDASYVVWIMLGTTAFVVLALLISTSYRVRIDENGLEARSTIGWPVFRVHADNIAEVAATQISPLAEFGGWGIRWMPGRLGLVTRAGEGLVIVRKDDNVFALTVDDAATAASLLETVSQGK